MTPDHSTALRDLKYLPLSALFAGLGGGGLLVLLTSYFRKWCWDDIACYNHSLFDGASSHQILVLGILVLFLVGMLSAALQRKDGERQVSIGLAGGISGIITFGIYVLNFEVALLLSHGSTALLQDLFLAISHDLVSHPLTFLGLALAMAGLTAFGAVIFSSRRATAADPEEGVRVSRLLLGSTILLILAVAVLPPFAAHAMLAIGVVDVNPSTAMIMTVVSVERTAPDTLVFTAHKVPPASALDPEVPFSIIMNGIDVSSATACAAGGFSATVDPPGGLSAARGSQAAWQGAVISNNDTPVDVTVMVHGADGSDLLVLNGMF